MDNQQILEHLDEIWTFGHDPTDEEREAVRSAMDIIEKYSKIGEWIPCSERLPTMEECHKNNSWFILDDGKKRYSGMFDYEKQCFVQFYFWQGIAEDKGVIAWQPFPDQYHDPVGREING